MHRRHAVLPLSVMSALLSLPASAQVALDRADPAVTEQSLPQPPAIQPAPSLTLPTVSLDQPAVAARARPVIATAIVVAGNARVPTAAFAPALVPYIGRELGPRELSDLAGAVARIARDAGYPFATASIEPQDVAGGILRVTLDEGTIDAVRVIGAINPLADRILSAALVTGRAVRQSELERAILLVGDIPGMTVKGSSYVQKDGFGILLVTISEDKAAAYIQLDNRGSREVGPIRSTILASARHLLQAGDEAALVIAQTPLQPSEFAFLRARYAAPIDRAGGMVSLSGSYGRAHPGAALAPLDVIGNSYDVATSYTRPLARSRARSLWAAVEFRALRSDQSLRGRMLRDDRIATVTGSLNGATRLAGGTLRAEGTMIAGLPLDGVTHEGDRLASRSDGDARFVTWALTADWTRSFGEVFSIAVGAAGQLASRPLLASMEIGAGGPGFGRGYDYAERTGDDGVLGSLELRADTGRLSDLVTRSQLYAFVDGGHVWNLRHGAGGGSLVSTGAGLRIGTGLADAMVEVALPLNADRFDTGTRRPRLSLRLSRSF